MAADETDVISRSWSPSHLRRLGVLLVALLSMALVAGLGFYLARTSAASKAKVLSDFEQRARMSTRLLTTSVGASDTRNRAYAEETFGGSAATLRTLVGKGLGTPWWVVLDADGKPVASDPPSYMTTATSLVADPGFATAAETGKLTFGDVLNEDGVLRSIGFQPYRSGSATRYLAMPITLTDIGTIVDGGLQIPGGKTYLIDTTGKVVAGPATAGAALPLTDLTTALRTVSHGLAGGQYFYSFPVGASVWRLVMTSPQSHLMAPVQATEWAAWQVFGAFVVAMLLMLAIGAAALVSASRLARARLHDTLTGLPNRALFLERADAAIADWRRRRDRDNYGIAALFLDLDGFKPVNDTYGHAAGDSLLRQVSGRLVQAIRGEDYVSRFGGDEFLVLCRGLRADEKAHAVADRIRAAIAEPFVLDDGVRVTIGVSIGIAYLDDEDRQAATLIHHADLALYQAKENGRGRVETYTPEPAGVSRS